MIFFGPDLLRIQYRKVNFNLVTACLEGRVSRYRRSPDIDRLRKPTKQVFLLLTLR